MSQHLVVSALSSAQARASLTVSQISVDGFAGEQQTRGEKIEKLRRYIDGDSDAQMTTEMRDLLRVGAGSSAFGINHLARIVQAVSDRLELKRVEDTSKAANDWIREVSNFNELDELQLAVHDSALADGDTYLTQEWDNEKQQVRFIPAPAYDGSSGLQVLYENRGRSEIALAIKVWNITSEGGSIADTVRINVYYPDKIQKFISKNEQLRPFIDDSTDADGVAPWTDSAGKPLGVPVTHFKNDARTHDNYGRSAIDDAIPIQDVINRFSHSCVASAELAGFPVRKAINFDPPAALAPGDWIVINGSTREYPIDAEFMGQGEINPFLDGIAFYVRQMYLITNTPDPENMGSSASSGEALKQREIGLLGKVKRAQISFGNAWERAFEIAHRIATAFSADKPPAFENFEAEWREAEIRNVKELTENILLISDKIGDEMTIRMLANVYGWTEDEIGDILAQKESAMERNISALGAQLPRFNNLLTPTANPIGGQPTNVNGNQQNLAAA